MSVRRATQLSRALATDLDSREVTDGTIGSRIFFEPSEGLYQRLASLFKVRESR